jgi:phage terminase large subunit GpA-like protein
VSVAHALPGLNDGSRYRAALVRAFTPDPLLTIAEWAQQRRVVGADSGSSAPGRWDNAKTPFAVEIMACLDADHPARTVTLKVASQICKSEVALNWICQTIDVDPAPMMLLLPSLDEIGKWNATKWEPALDAMPGLRRKVLEVVERSRAGSTSSFKKFRGGFLTITTASSSKGLQARSIKRGIGDEISEMPEDAGGRGDPIEQMMTRGDAHPDAKFLLASTPAELPSCRVTQRYDASDRREFYCPCPHCGDFQTLDFDRLVAAPELPGAAALPCAGCGVLLTELDKDALLAGGVWIRRHPDERAGPVPPPHFAAADLDAHRARGSAGRDPGFWLTQVYSPFKPWGRLLEEARDAEKKGGLALKLFRQQKLALAWDPATDAPDHEKLHEARGLFVTRGVVPSWACLLTGACDVQNDRLEWAAYAWGPDKSGACIDWGVIEGDTLTDGPWIELAGVIGRRFPGEATTDLGFDAFGVDSGGGMGRTAKVYAFVRRSPGLKALKGSSKPRDLPLVEGGQAWAKDARGKSVRAKIWLVGVHEVKHTIYAMLHRGLDAAAAGERQPWGLYFPHDASEEHFRQLTAEVFRAPRSQRAGALGFWEKLPGRANEQLDLAVYAYALASSKGLERLSPSEWAALFAARAKPAEDAPLLDLVQRAVTAGAAERAATERAATERAAQGVSSPQTAAPAGVADAEPAAPATSAAPAARLAPNPDAGARSARLARLVRLNGGAKP